MKPAKLAFGFVCGFLAVVFFHQAVVGFYHGMGWVPNPPFRQTPIPPWGVPQIWNASFWGGVWGILFAVIESRRPAALPFWLFGALFGALLVLALGAWVIVPLIKGLPLFANGNVAAMARGVGIHAVWGLGLAFFWRGLPLLFSRR